MSDVTVGYEALPHLRGLVAAARLTDPAHYDGAWIDWAETLIACIGVPDDDSDRVFTGAPADDVPCEQCCRASGCDTCGPCSTHGPGKTLPTPEGFCVRPRFVFTAGPWHGLTEEENFVCSVADTLLDLVEDPATCLAGIIARAAKLWADLPSLTTEMRSP